MKITYKICRSCGDKFYKKEYCSQKRFTEKIKFCSTKCRLVWLRKNTWNKGKHYSDEQMKKMNLSGLEKGRCLRKGKTFPEFSGENHPNWKPKTSFNCPVCKKEMILSPWELRRKYCSLRCRGLDKRGEKSPVFKGENASTKLRQRIMQMAEYTEWRLSCFRRDGFICRECKNPKSRPFEIHHIKSYAEIKKQYGFKTPEDARKCKELWDTNNGMTLCRSCHRMTKTYPKNLI